nr:carotenoid biosynthesis protein [Gordonia rhizosphera]
MAFPFTAGGTLAMTTISVFLLAGAALTDAAASVGVRAAVALLAVAGGGGLLAEAVGVRTGYPFGGYDYTGTLGAEVIGVPVVVPLAWVMMSWPALVVARRLVGGRARWATALVGAWALTSWDVFLDPQMVDLGYWQWDRPSPALPGVEGIPLTNFAGWFVVSLLMVTILDRLVPRDPRPPTLRTDAVPVTAYLWTYFSSVIAHAVFFGRPPVALVGGVVMGIVAVPLAISVFREVREVRGARA